jgi:hypothetical protein
MLRLKLDYNNQNMCDLMRQEILLDERNDGFGYGKTIIGTIIMHQ